MYYFKHTCLKSFFSLSFEGYIICVQFSKYNKKNKKTLMYSKKCKEVRLNFRTRFKLSRDAGWKNFLHM